MICKKKMATKKTITHETNLTHCQQTEINQKIKILESNAQNESYKHLPFNLTKNKNILEFVQMQI